MLSEERRALIGQLVNEQRRVVVRDLCRRFRTSSVTIRKDLEELEKRGVLTLVHGGAVLIGSVLTDLSLTEKEQIRVKEKQRIADRAVEFVREGDVVIMDSGSTTTLIARRLKRFTDLTLVTNAVNIASELAPTEVEVILTGGMLREKMSGRH